MVADSMTIDVVIPTYITNQKQLGMSIRCINQAREMTSLKFKLIIVETASNYLSDQADIHIYERERTTADRSINNGFYCCRGDMTVLLTNDVGLKEGWLESLVECFDKRIDCGMATLASTQFGHTKEDKIEEGVWCSVFMMPREYMEFDENYINSWEDSDLLMQTYSRGYKMYRNFNCVVDHDPGQTVYKDPLTQTNYEKNRAYFMDKWKDSKLDMYQILTKGYVV